MNLWSLNYTFVYNCKTIIYNNSIIPSNYCIFFHVQLLYMEKNISCVTKIFNMCINCLVNVLYMICIITNNFLNIIIYSLLKYMLNNKHTKYTFKKQLSSFINININVYIYIHQKHTLMM